MLQTLYDQRLFLLWYAPRWWHKIDDEVWLESWWFPAALTLERKKAHPLLSACVTS